jgi:hypothetical protein
MLCMPFPMQTKTTDEEAFALAELALPPLRGDTVNIDLHDKEVRKQYFPL